MLKSRVVMGNKPEPEDAMITCDDIGDLARAYLMEPGLRGLEQIDEQIDRARAIRAGTT